MMKPAMMIGKQMRPVVRSNRTRPGTWTSSDRAIDECVPNRTRSETQTDASRGPVASDPIDWCEQVLFLTLMLYDWLFGFVPVPSRINIRGERFLHPSMDDRTVDGDYAGPIQPSILFLP